MIESLPLESHLVVTLITGFVPAIITSAGALTIAQHNYRQDLKNSKNNSSYKKQAKFTCSGKSMSAP